MTSGMSVHEFDRAVKSILDQAFGGVLELGLVSEEALFSVMTGMRNSLRKAFPAMSGSEAELHLLQLREQCRDTVDSIFAVAETVYWN